MATTALVPRSQAHGVPPMVIVQAHFDMAIGVRPAWWVLAAGLAVAAAATARRQRRPAVA